MTAEALKKKTDRYLQGQSFPAETKQIQNWLSCPGKDSGNVSEDEKARIEDEILTEVQQHTAYPLFYRKSETWWKKFTTFF